MKLQNENYRTAKDKNNAREPSSASLFQGIQNFSPGEEMDDRNSKTGKKQKNVKINAGARKRGAYTKGRAILQRWNGIATTPLRRKTYQKVVIFQESSCHGIPANVAPQQDEGAALRQ